jgi:hypothetical protein
VAELVATRLAQFIAAQSTRSWQPGTVDCCLFLADWAIWLGHADPSADLRGAYDSDDGFRAIIAAHQGLVPVVAACVGNIGGKRISAPLCGAVGVIGSQGNIQRQWGAIFDGNRWLVRFHEGVGPLSARPLAIWEI